MVCRVPLGFLGFLDPLVHGGVGVHLGLMEIQASQALLEPKVTWAYLGCLGIQDLLDERDTRAILDQRGTPENRGRQDLRAAQGPKVTLAGVTWTSRRPWPQRQPGLHWTPRTLRPARV